MSSHNHQSQSHFLTKANLSPFPLQINIVVALLASLSSISSSLYEHSEPSKGKNELHPTFTNFFGHLAIAILVSCSFCQVVVWKCHHLHHCRPCRSCSIWVHRALHPVLGLGVGGQISFF